MDHADGFCLKAAEGVFLFPEFSSSNWIENKWRAHYQSSPPVLIDDTQEVLQLQLPPVLSRGSPWTMLRPGPNQ
jgi:hypothetical protein